LKIDVSGVVLEFLGASWASEEDSADKEASSWRYLATCSRQAGQQMDRIATKSGKSANMGHQDLEERWVPAGFRLPLQIKPFGAKVGTGWVLKGCRVRSGTRYITRDQWASPNPSCTQPLPEDDENISTWRSLGGCGGEGIFM